MNEFDELNRLLSAWAAGQRMTSDQVLALRTRVLASAPTDESVDVDWLWSLLEPVTRLLDRLDASPHPDPARWLPFASDTPGWTSYLQLSPAT
jgi:hypothetical protein